jgi:hypothetical protein
MLACDAMSAIHVLQMAWIQRAVDMFEFAVEKHQKRG